MSAAVELLRVKGVPKLILDPLPPHLVPLAQEVEEVLTRKPQSESKSTVIS